MRLFEFELCLAIGCKHPDFLEDELTREQLKEWMAFHSLSPIGERRADLRLAIQTAHLRSCWVEASEVDPQEFMPQFPIYEQDDSYTLEESPEDIAARQRKEAAGFAL